MANDVEQTTLDIIFLTNALSHFQFPTFSAQSTSKRRKLALLQHISTLLARDVAVTGGVGVDGHLYCTCLYVNQTNGTKGEAPDRGNETPTIQVVFDSESQDSTPLARTILEDWMNTRLEDNHTNIFIILDALSKSPVINAELLEKFLLLVVKHSYPNIAARLEAKMWATVVLKEHDFSSAWCQEALPRTMKAETYRLSELLQQNNIPVTDVDGDFEFEVTEQNIKAVSGVHHTLLEDLKGRTESEKDIKDVCNILLTLRDISSSGLLGLLFGDPELCDKLAMELEDQEFEDTEPVVQHLKTIHACITAIFSLVQSRHLKLAIRSRSITISSPNLNIPDDLLLRTCQALTPVKEQEVVEAYLNDPRCREKVLTRKLNNTTIHAEAGLMAVICAARNSSTGDDWKDVFSKENDDVETAIAVGVEQKCCWCCWRLSELLDQHSSALPKFVLRGTHGRILPWYPSPYGIPVKVLRTLRDELLKKLCIVSRRRTVVGLQDSDDEENCSGRAPKIRIIH